MTTEEIIRLAFELGNAVAQSQEVGKLKDIQAQVSSDTSTYDLIIRYQDAKNKLENKYNDGLLVTKGEEDHINILEQQLNANQLVQELVHVQESFDNLMQAVYFAMNQAISGDSCSSGCDSCGGSCC
ncbi:MAG: YlbF family regulator [Syntrophomonadaceae bacterium]|nr:YlbF family regulator [Syntrophomonadaceae bacterium]